MACMFDRVKEGNHAHLTKPALAPKGHSGHSKHGGIKGVIEIQHIPQSHEVS